MDLNCRFTARKEMFPPRVTSPHFRRGFMRVAESNAFHLQILAAPTLAIFHAPAAPMLFLLYRPRCGEDAAQPAIILNSATEGVIDGLAGMNSVPKKSPLPAWLSLPPIGIGSSVILFEVSLSSAGDIKSTLPLADGVHGVARQGRCH